MRIKSLFATAAVAALTFTGATVAQADDGTTSETTVTYSQECLDQFKALTASTGESFDTSVCKETTTLVKSGEDERVTLDDVSADTGLDAGQKASLSRAVKAGAVKSKHYTKFTTGGVYTATQDGTFYYNGAQAWVGQTISGKRGSHSCRANYAVGVGISTNSCSESGSASAKKMYYSWTVSLVAKGWPVSYEVSNSITVKANGTTA